MVFIHVLLERISIQSVSAILVGAYAIWYLFRRIDEYRHIRHLGTTARPSGPIFPMAGLDIVAGLVNSARNRQDLEFWRRKLFGIRGLWTTESRMLDQRVIFTAEPANIKAILATQFREYGKGEAFHAEWKDFLGDSIFTTDGDQWHASRQLLRPQFTRIRVSDLQCFESHVETLFRAIANGGPLAGENQEVDAIGIDGKVVDICDLFFRYTLDTATEFLLGYDAKSLTTPDQEFANAFNDVQRIQNLVARTNMLGPFLPKPVFWRGLAVMNRLVNFYIQRALAISQAELISKSDNTSSTFLDALARFTHDPKVLRDQIIAVLLAGRDTTAGSLSWALYELGRNAGAVAKLRTEILATVGYNRNPTYEDLKKMSYLKAIINETLRLYPAVPFNVRLALEDTTLPRGGGRDGSQPLAVLKDTRVFYSPLVMQRRADLYPPVSATFADPEVLSPERWANWHPRPHEYIPFNAGPRICIAQQFALTQMEYVLCRMFQKYERVTNSMHDIDGGKPVLKADVVMSPGQGVHVAFWEASKV
ncbi:cytochrome P450 [Ilyonectria destructans]|nr:cytochrome P450 [Ilyonectria destructans]